MGQISELVSKLFTGIYPKFTLGFCKNMNQTSPHIIIIILDLDTVKPPNNATLSIKSLFSGPSKTTLKPLYLPPLYNDTSS